MKASWREKRALEDRLQAIREAYIHEPGRKPARSLTVPECLERIMDLLADMIEVIDAEPLN